MSATRSRPNQGKPGLLKKLLGLPKYLLDKGVDFVLNYEEQNASSSETGFTLLMVGAMLFVPSMLVIALPVILAGGIDAIALGSTGGIITIAATAIAATIAGPPLVIGACAMAKGFGLVFGIDILVSGAMSVAGKFKDLIFPSYEEIHCDSEGNCNLEIDSTLNPAAYGTGGIQAALCLPENNGLLDAESLPQEFSKEDGEQQDLGQLPQQQPGFLRRATNALRNVLLFSNCCTPTTGRNEQAADLQLRFPTTP